MKTYKLNEIENLHIAGRTAGANEKGELALFWAGSALEVNVKTSEVWVEVESDFSSSEVWLCVFVNGRKISRFMVPKGKSKFCILRALNPSKENLISIMRDTQPMSGDVNQILKITSLEVSDETEFLPVPEKDLKIEFIGDSITSGEGLYGGPWEQDWISQWISVSENYAVKTGRALNADFNILSQCGWGVVCGWDNNVTSAMPPVYDKVCGLQNGECQKKLGSQETWDFSKFQPDFVVVNLGTNDSGAFNQPAWKDPVTGTEYKMHLDENGKPVPEDGNKIASAVSDFLKVIRKNNPEAKILWVWGMIDMPDVGGYVKQGIDSFISETGDKKTSAMILPSMSLEKTDEEKGSRGHPGPLTHRLASEKIIEYIKNNR